MSMDLRNDGSLIVFFDLETTMPPCLTIIEFGVILVCPRTLVERDSYSKLVRPANLSIITPEFERIKGITREDVSHAPFFADIAHEIFDLLHGRIWAGHNIVEFDSVRIREAFAQIGWQPPQPKGIIDTLPLLSETFGRRAGDMKMASLGSYFELGEQAHRSLADCRMNLQVLKNCGAILFLESRFSDILTTESWVSPQDVCIPLICASRCPFYCDSPKIQILHRSVRLKLRCTHLKVRYGIRPEYPKPTFVVDAPPTLCEILEECDQQAQSMFEQSGSSSEWNDTVTIYGNTPTIRLRIPTVREGHVTHYGTDIFRKEAASGAEQQLQLGDFNNARLKELFAPGTSIDAFILVDTHDYEEQASIWLVAEKLVIHS